MAKRQRDILRYLSTDNSKCVDNNNEDEDVSAKIIDSELSLASKNANVSSISDSSHDDCVLVDSSMDAQAASSSSTH